jgi:hypothetical protein
MSKRGGQQQQRADHLRVARRSRALLRDLSPAVTLQKRKGRASKHDARRIILKATGV